MEPTPLPLASTLSIREYGYNEFLLQDQIYENLSCLGLGELDKSPLVIGIVCVLIRAGITYWLAAIVLMRRKLSHLRQGIREWDINR